MRNEPPQNIANQVWRRMRQDHPESAEPATRSEALPLSLLLLAAFAIRLPGLTESLWYDELWATRVVLGNLGDTLRAVLWDVHPPLYTALMFGWIRLFGDSELSVRAIPLMAGLSTIALMPALGARLATRSAGWVAAVLLTLSPVHIWYSQEARHYALMILFAVVLVLTWVRLDDEGSRRWRAPCFILLSVLLSQLHYFAVAVPAVLFVCALAQRRHVKVTAAGLTLSILGVAAVVGVRWLAGYLTTEVAFLGSFTLGAALDLFFSWFTLGDALPLGGRRSSPASRIVGSGIIAVTSVLVAIWLVVGWRRLNRWRWWTHLLLLLAVPCVLLALYALGQRNYYIERSALISLPFFYLAVSAGATLIANTAIRRLAVGATMVGAAVALAAFRAQPDNWTVYKPNPDWRTVSREITSERAGPTERVAIFSTTPLKELVYYLPGSAECPWPPRNPQARQEPTSLKGTLTRRFARSPTLTCGPDGTALTRLYVVEDSTPQWIDEVRAYEGDARSLLVLNHYWPEPTPGLIRALRSSGRSLPLFARARGLEVFGLEEK